MVLIIHGMQIARDGEESRKERSMIISLRSSIKMRDPFCFELGMELLIATLKTKRNTTVILKSIEFSVYAARLTLSKG